MAEQKAVDYDLPADLIFPVQLVDPLSTIEEAERGNTPRPSRARLSFVSGVSAIQKKQFENAFKQVRTSFTLSSVLETLQMRFTSDFGVSPSSPHSPLSLPPIRLLAPQIA